MKQFVKVGIILAAFFAGGASALAGCTKADAVMPISTPTQPKPGNTFYTERAENYNGPGELFIMTDSQTGRQYFILKKTYLGKGGVGITMCLRER